MMSAQADWGPLSQPIDPQVRDDSPPWRDNAFLTFWDPAAGVHGTLHTSTSPNAEGRRARLSVAHGGRVVEVVEPLEPGTFTSESITFALGESFSVDAPELSGELTFTPRFALADYTGPAAPKAFGLDEAQPLQHYQRAATVAGRLTLAGETVEIDGHGFRDRTWGLRDESSSVAEYFGFMWVFDEFALTQLRLLGNDGKDATLGFVLGEHATALGDVSLTRDAAGLFAAADIGLADGGRLQVRATERHVGFWCPMGWERSGPTLSAYDEFAGLRTADGTEGFGMVEQGIVKRLY